MRYHHDIYYIEDLLHGLVLNMSSYFMSLYPNFTSRSNQRVITWDCLGTVLENLDLGFLW